MIGYASVGLQVGYVDDFDNWKENRNEVCEAAIDAAIDLNINAAQTGTVCGAGMRGGWAGIAVCGLALLKHSNDWRKARKLEKECNASYPGPGNW